MRDARYMSYSYHERNIEYRKKEYLEKSYHVRSYPRNFAVPFP